MTDLIVFLFLCVDISFVSFFKTIEIDTYVIFFITYYFISSYIHDRGSMNK